MNSIFQVPLVDVNALDAGNEGTAGRTATVTLDRDGIATVTVHESNCGDGNGNGNGGNDGHVFRLRGTFAADGTSMRVTWLDSPGGSETQLRVATAVLPALKPGDPASVQVSKRECNKRPSVRASDRKNRDAQREREITE